MILPLHRQLSHIAIWECTARGHPAPEVSYFGNILCALCMHALHGVQGKGSCLQWPRRPFLHTLSN